MDKEEDVEDEVLFIMNKLGCDAIKKMGSDGIRTVAITISELSESIKGTPADEEVLKTMKTQQSRNKLFYNSGPVKYSNSVFNCLQI